MSAPSSPRLARLEGLLRQPLRVTINDGRIFLGTFVGTDKPLNLVLINAEEYRVGVGQNGDGRYVGQILVPWRLIEKVEAQEKHSAGFVGRGGDGGMYL